MLICIFGGASKKIDDKYIKDGYELSLELAKRGHDLIYGGEGTNATSLAFGEILSWTLIWAFFATFTNYFLGMFVAMMINKKGIKFI